jgi:hypothetical protein
VCCRLEGRLNCEGLMEGYADSENANDETIDGNEW